MFSVESIDKLLSSQRSNGILYYRVKWKQLGSGTTWEYASSIPQVLIREFHASRTMSGKKRRRPLKGKHKFFERTENSGENVSRVSQDKNEQTQQVARNKGNENSENHVSSASANVKSEQANQECSNISKRIVGVKFLKGKPYYIVQRSNQEIECLPASMVHFEAKEFITMLMQMDRDVSTEEKIWSIQNKHVPRPFDPLSHSWADKVCEIRIGKDESWEFLMSFCKLELPPRWVPFDCLSGCSIHDLIHDLKNDYHKAIGKFRY